MPQKKSEKKEVTEKETMKKGVSKSQVDDQHFWISLDAFKRSTKLTDAAEISKFLEKLERKEYFWEVVVLAMDIRKSSIALVNVEDFQTYHDAICDYVCYLAATWKSHKYIKDTFFDKFTGDGAIFFLTLPEQKEPNRADHEDYDSYKKACNDFENTWINPLKHAVEYAIDLVVKLLDSVLPDIRKTCGTLPQDFGISVGIDAGECLLTDLKASEDYEEDYSRKRSPLEELGGNVTIIGRSVVGATRMVSEAEPYETVINSYPGGKLKAKIDDPNDPAARNVRFNLEPKCVSTKEYDCVEAYRVVSGQLDQMKEQMVYRRVQNETRPLQNK